MEAVSASIERPWYLDHPIANALLLSPPGCGKTETLARWIGGLVKRGLIRHPHQVLGLTFSNKAKANLRARLARELGSQWWRHARVMNLHGFAFHTYQHHASAIGRKPLERSPQRGWQDRTIKAVTRTTGCDETELRATLRSAKSGLFTEEQVLSRLEEANFPAALEYEHRVRAEGRFDFDDLIRLGLWTISEPRVLELYRARFAALVVDEVQDLSRGQFELARGIGEGRTVFAGDRAQGIYTFAGAEPQWVFDQIKHSGAVQIDLQRSYRSSPPVLRAVSAIGEALGGSSISCATPAEWGDRGALRITQFTHAVDEALEVVKRAAAWLEQNPEQSVAIIARTKPRRQWVDAQVIENELDAEIWDFPAHRPMIVALLIKHSIEASEGTEAEIVDDLYTRCSGDVDSADLDALDELEEVFESINELLKEMPLAEIIGGIRLSSSPDSPVGPGLHLLNGHVGKGQEFGKVFIVGLEEAFLPHYAAIKSRDPAKINEELSVLHVMASRAQEELEVSFCDVVPDWQGIDRRRDPCRWLSLVADVADEFLDSRQPF